MSCYRSLGSAWWNGDIKTQSASRDSGDRSIRLAGAAVPNWGLPPSSASSSRASGPTAARCHYRGSGKVGTARPTTAALLEPRMPAQVDSKTPSIFISYRRSDSLDATGRIYDRLTDEFGPTAVFRD